MTESQKPEQPTGETPQASHVPQAPAAEPSSASQTPANEAPSAPQAPAPGAPSTSHVSTPETLVPPTYEPNRLTAAPGQTEPPQNPNDFAEQRDLNSARTLSLVATIGGPVSFIIGGIALSSVALVCAIIALIKTKRVLANPQSKFTTYARALRQTAIMGIGISAVALALNVVGVLMIMPQIMNALQTGDYSSLLGNGANGTGAPQAPSSGESAWG